MEVQEDDILESYQSGVYDPFSGAMAPGHLQKVIEDEDEEEDYYEEYFDEGCSRHTSLACGCCEDCTGSSCAMDCPACGNKCHWDCEPYKNYSHDIINARTVLANAKNLGGKSYAAAEHTRILGIACARLESGYYADISKYEPLKVDAYEKPNMCFKALFGQANSFKKSKN